MENGPASRTMKYLHSMDIAHPPFRVIEAENVLNETLWMIKVSASLRGMKIIHGYGKSGKGGSLKEAVLNWAYRNKNRIRGAIAGEQYSVHHQLTQEMRLACGQVPDSDLDTGNPGMTIIWVK